MDEAAREVLKKHKSEIKKNLILDDDILDALEANDTLKSDHVEKIKAEKTNYDKISTLLSILQKRGSGAFQALIDAIKQDYRYLADKLLNRYQEEDRKLDKDSGHNSEESLEPIERPSSASSFINKEVPSPVSNNQSIFPNVASNVDHTANRVPETVVMQGHLQQDKHSLIRPPHSLDMIYPTNHFQPHNSRRKSNHSIDFATHQSLNGMYTKLKMHLFHINEREQSFSSSPVPVNFEMVEDLLDQLLKLEQDCYKAIGGNSKESLRTSIVNLKILKADLQKNLNKKEEQIKKYGDKILKLETKCKNNDITMKQQDNTIKMLRLENTRLNEENEKLREEVSRNKHTEETEEEAHMKMMSLKQATKHNEELKKRVTRYEKELELMTLKFDALNHHTSSLTAQHVGTVNANEKKKVTDAMKVSELTNPAVSSSSTLQECREICAGTNSKNARHNLREMRTKILFAESKRDESMKVKSRERNVQLLERIISENTMDEQISEQDELQTSRRHHSTSSNAYESMTKQVTNKQSVIHNTLLKQKSMTQIRKPVTVRGVKKNPRWVRKPLK